MRVALDQTFEGIAVARGRACAAGRRLALGALAALPLALLGGCGSEAAASTGAESVDAATAAAPLAAPADEPRQQDKRTAADQRDAGLEADLRELVDVWYLRARNATKRPLPSDEVRVSISVRDARTGAVVADVRAGRSLRPASNLKLVTAAAGLYLLGPEGQFATRYELGGPIEDGVLRGGLVVRAGGDPIVRDGSFGAVEGYFDVLAAELAQRGVRRIAGAVVLDEADYLEPGPGPAWPSKDQHWKDYCALAAGLTINGGVLEAVVTTHTGASHASVELHPAPTGLPTSIGVRQVPGRLNDVRVGATVSKVTVGGKLGEAVPRIEAAFRHPDPIALFGSVLEARLARAQIAIDGGVARRRGPPAGEHLVTITSPITDSLVPINTHSNNSVADQLFLKLGSDFGGGGTRAGGLAALRLALDRLGVSTQGLRAVDGSGLSRDNRVSPAQLTALLWSVLGDLGQPGRQGEAAELYLDSLAVMGRSGTLEGRMRGTPAEGAVFAKTGFIDGTSGLSGWLQDASGRPLVFSILVNYPTVGGLNNKAWKPMQEAMVARLLEAR